MFCIFIANLADQTATQVKIATCPQMDIQIPSGQDYSTKSNFLRIIDHHFGFATITVCPHRLVTLTIVALLRWSILWIGQSGL